MPLLLQCKKNSLETQMHFSPAVSWIQTKLQEKSKMPPRPPHRCDAAATLRPFSGIPGGAGDVVSPSVRPSVRPPCLFFMLLLGLSTCRAVPALLALFALVWLLFDSSAR